MTEFFTHLTAILIVWFSDGTYTISTHRIDQCYAIEAAVNNLEGSDTRLVDELHLPSEHASANSALCVDPFPVGEEEF